MVIHYLPNVQQFWTILVVNRNTLNIAGTLDLALCYLGILYRARATITCDMSTQNT